MELCRILPEGVMYQKKLQKRDKCDLFLIYFQYVEPICLVESFCISNSIEAAQEMKYIYKMNGV